MNKYHPRIALHRHNAAELAISIRAMWPTLKGEWTRRDWNQQALAAARNHVENMVYFDRVNQPELLSAEALQ